MAEVMVKGSDCKANVSIGEDVSSINPGTPSAKEEGHIQSSAHFNGIPLDDFTMSQDESAPEYAERIKALLAEKEKQETTATDEAPLKPLLTKAEKEAKTTIGIALESGGSADSIESINFVPLKKPASNGFKDVLAMYKPKVPSKLNQELEYPRYPGYDDSRQNDCSESTTPQAAAQDGNSDPSDSRGPTQDWEHVSTPAGGSQGNASDTSHGGNNLEGRSIAEEIPRLSRLDRWLEDLPDCETNDVEEQEPWQSSPVDEDLDISPYDESTSVEIVTSKSDRERPAKSQYTELAADNKREDSQDEDRPMTDNVTSIKNCESTAEPEESTDVGGIRTPSSEGYHPLSPYGHFSTGLQNKRDSFTSDSEIPLDQDITDASSAPTNKSPEETTLNDRSLLDGDILDKVLENYIRHTQNLLSQGSNKKALTQSQEVARLMGGVLAGRVRSSGALSRKRSLSDMLDSSAWRG